MNKFTLACLLGFVAATDLDSANKQKNAFVQMATTTSTGQEYISTEWSDPISITFENNTDEEVKMFWYDWWGVAQPYSTISPGGEATQGTYATNPWQPRGVNGSESTFKVEGVDVFIPTPSDNNGTFEINKVVVEPEVVPQVFAASEYSTLVELFFTNETDSTVKLWWHDYSGVPQEQRDINPGQTVHQYSYVTHPWSATNEAGTYLHTGDARVLVTQGSDDQQTITITREAVVSEAEEDEAIVPHPVQSDSEEEVRHCYDGTDHDSLRTITGNQGTIFTDSSWVPDESPTAFDSVDSGQACSHHTYDRRQGGRFDTFDLWCFDATFTDNADTIRVQVNSQDFDKATARQHAITYATAVGRIPKILRLDARTITIHDGVEAFGGGNNDFLIHVGQAEQVYTPWHNLEETLIHEGCHTSLDSHLYGTEQWTRAQEGDNKFSSDYARDHPGREDVAETYLVWFATKYARESFTAEALEDWECYMQDRFDVFEEMSCQPGMMSPWPDC